MSRFSPLPWAIALLYVSTPHLAMAQDADEMDALALADKTQEKTEPVSRQNIRLYSEIAANAGKGDSGYGTGGLAALSLVWERPLSSNALMVFSDRLDSYQCVFPMRGSHDVNTVREAYIDWKWNAQLSVQTGRVNVRQGVARGFNPTDYFREQAIRSFVGTDPDALRANRQGVVVVAPQAVWDTGSATVFLAPKLAERPGPQTYAFDAGSTNNRNRALLAISQQLADDVRPQLSVLGDEQARPQWGMNLTKGIGDRVVAYAEGSAGWRKSMIGASLGLPETPRFTQQAALGATYTTDSKISLTAEYGYNGAGADQADWLTLKTRGPMAVQKVLVDALNRSDPPSRRNWFMHFNWKDMGMDGLDASAYVRWSQVDGSRQYWSELRYRWNSRHEVYVQRVLSAGALGSVYGSVPAANTFGLFYRFYFF